MNGLAQNHWTRQLKSSVNDLQLWASVCIFICLVWLCWHWILNCKLQWVQFDWVQKWHDIKEKDQHSETCRISARSSVGVESSGGNAWISFLQGLIGINHTQFFMARRNVRNSFFNHGPFMIESWAKTKVWCHRTRCAISLSIVAMLLLFCVIVILCLCMSLWHRCCVEESLLW